MQGDGSLRKLIVIEKTQVPHFILKIPSTLPGYLIATKQG